ncbi:hypothetical protein H1R20_g640, partial [Candolleomyces eurysporus]
MLLARLFLQLGTFLDYYTGQHEPSLSGKLRESLVSFEQDTGSLEAATMMLDSIPRRHLALFPQSIIPQKVRSGEWPVAVFLHGTDDTAVPVHESRNLHKLILASSSPPTFTEGAPEEDITQHASKGSKLIEVPGAEHSFDLVPDAEEKYGKVFDEIVEYLHGVEVTQKISLFQNGCFERVGQTVTSSQRLGTARQPWKRSGMAGPSVDSHGCHIMLLERINPPTPTYF